MFTQLHSTFLSSALEVELFFETKEAANSLLLGISTIHLTPPNTAHEKDSAVTTILPITPCATSMVVECDLVFLDCYDWLGSVSIWLTQSAMDVDKGFWVSKARTDCILSRNMSYCLGVVCMLQIQALICSGVAAS